MLRATQKAAKNTVRELFRLSNVGNVYRKQPKVSAQLAPTVVAARSCFVCQCHAQCSHTRHLGGLRLRQAVAALMVWCGVVAYAPELGLSDENVDGGV